MPARLSLRHYCCGVLTLFAGLVLTWRFGLIAACLLLIVVAGAVYIGTSISRALTFTSDQDLRQLSENIPGMIVVNDSHGNLEYVNKQVLGFVGKEFDDLKNLGWTKVLHPDDVDRTMDAWQDALRTKETMVSTIRIRRFDGVYHWFKTRNQPLLNDKGEVVRWYSLIFDIDNRKRTEDAVRESERQLHDLIETIPAMVWRGTPEGQLDYGNQRLLDYTGETIEVLSGGAWKDLIHPSELDSVVQTWLGSANTGNSYQDIYRFRRFDGEYRWIQSVGEPFYDADGQIIHWYGLIFDIDEKKKAEEALEASERDMRQIVDSVPGMITVADCNGQHEYANKRALDYTGTTVEESRGLGFIETIHPDEQEFVKTAWLHSVANGIPMDLNHRWRRHDGVYRWFHVRVDPLFDENAEVIRWFGLLTDIEDQLAAEGSLRESEHELRLITETIPAIVTRRTASGELEYANQRLVEYTGKSFSELVRDGFSIVHPDDHDAFFRTWRTAIENGEPFQIDHRLRGADGVYRWFQTRGEPLRDSLGSVIRRYALVIDIDDSKRTEEALRNTQARLARTSQIMAVAELSASIAHEVSQPLFAVLANAQACQTWLSGSPPNIERALITTERIIRDAEDAAEVVRRTRDLFRRADPSRELLDLNDLIIEVVRLMAGQFTLRRIELEMDLSPSLPKTNADRIQIQQVMMNLIQNGLEATDSAREQPGALQLRTHLEAENIIVEVCDQGVGVENPEQIFEPFFTTKESGMGIGLAISRSIIEAHQGVLRALPNHPTGTRFIFTLPVFRDNLS